jgi:hypothetical protein
MKKVLLILAFILGMSTNAQKVYNLDIPKDSVHYKMSGDLAIYQGERHFVYISEKGKLFIWVISKRSGKKYKKYLN